MSRALVFLSLFILGFAAPAAAYSELDSRLPNKETNRTANRSPEGLTFYPDFLFNRPEHYEFLPNVSNHDAQNQHPQQWEGQDWDTSAWNAERDTPKSVLQDFYTNKTFHKQYERGTHIVVLEVGPTFYKLSDLDQRRSLKLLADYSGIFNRGIEMMELRDWSTHGVIGAYTKRGMMLN